MSQGTSCKIASHRPRWVVIQRLGNASAFNGYHWTPSDYSCVRCPICPAHWRTKAAYVSSLPDAPKDWAVSGKPETLDDPPPAPRESRPGAAREREEFYPAFLVPGMNPNDWKKKK